MKKILLILILSISSLFAFNPDFWFDVSHPEYSISIVSDKPTKLDPNPKDWIGVYKKGADNSWDNVKAWTWVKEALQENDTSAELLLDLPAGDYVARYFLNNSYTTFKEKEFTIKSIENEAAIYIILTPGPNAIFVDSTTSGEGNKDWIGVYKKGADNSWENVLAWTWCYWDNGQYHGNPPIININPSLSDGEYEVRLFYHNSYEMEAKASFTIGDVVNEEKIFPASQTWNAEEGNVNSYVEYNEPSYESNNDDPDKVGMEPTTQWVGVFRKGAERKLSNLVAWTWVGYRIKPSLKFYNKDLLQESGTSYDIVYFRGDDYSDPKETGTIIIEW